MSNFSYDPFNKPLKELTADDVLKLCTVEEGWYVEYKRELPKAKAIAKSISAFANTYGGWFFIGVEEKSKDEPVAGSFPGLADDDVDGALQTIRNAIGAHLSAAPIIDTRVVKGPSSDGSLQDGRSVICVRVPLSMNAPYVHSGGQIYRRVADGSDPKAETDRHLLDQLWKRADKLDREYKEWVLNDPEFTNAESNTPYLRVMLVPDLWKERGARLDMTLGQARSLFNSSSGEGTRIPFDSVHQVSNGFLARQVKDNDPSSQTLSWRLNYDLTSEIIIPINIHKADAHSVYYELEGYDNRFDFCNILRSSKSDSFNVIDLNMMYLIIKGVATIQEDILKHAGWSDGYFFKGRLLNLWRSIPFIDTRDYVEDCREHGFPLSLASTVTIPGGYEPQSFREVDQDLFSAADNPGNISQAIQIFIPIAQAFGVSIYFDDEKIHDFVQIAEAGTRAIENQSLRNAKRAS